MTAPGTVLQGDAATVEVALANQGTQSETFAVTLTDTTAGAAIGSQSVTLGAGASQSVSFTWATSGTTSPGDHVLKAEAAPVTGETDVADNSKTATTTVKQASHDVAVSGVTAPAEVVQGNSAAVDVTVLNEGTYAESFTVTLRDTTAGVEIGTQSASLAAGASQKLAFPWATSTSTATGSHTLTATASTVSGETDTADNSKSTTVTVTSKPAGDANNMYVSAIDLSSASNKLYATVTARRDSDADNQAESTDATVSQARVSLTLKKDTGETWSGAADTDGNGQVTFSLRKPERGTYTATVTNLTHGTYTYASALNVETSDSYVVGSSAGANSDRQATPPAGRDVPLDR